MNQTGLSMTLSDAGGVIHDGRAMSVGVVLKSALTGTLTVSGIVNAGGSPVAWSMNAASGSGSQSAPGAGHTGGQQLNYVLSNPGADGGKAVVYFVPA